MGRPSARLSDMHVCPAWTGHTPHVGGPIIPSCAPNVFVGSLPSARVGDRAFCIGPTDVIVQGSSTVYVNGRNSARIGDRTAHGGVIVSGDGSVLVGG